MTRGGFKTIAQQGGLKVWLDKLGIDYGYVVHHFQLGLDNTAIAKLLNDKYPERPQKLHRTTVALWRKNWKEEGRG